MSAEIVNLRRARKAKARDAHASAGAENRVRFGRTAAERETLAFEQARAMRHLDAHRRDRSNDAGDNGDAH